MKYKENKIKTILLILIFLIIVFDIFVFFYKKSSSKFLPVNNVQQEEIKRDDDYLINYKIYDNDIPQIKLTIYNKAGVVKIIYPDGQIGEYDNKTELETTFNIQENGEYDFIIYFADGKEITEKVVVNFLSKDNNPIEEPILNINNDYSEDNNSLINPQPSSDNIQDNNISNNDNSNNNNNNPVVEDRVIGKIYFNKPIGWSNLYLNVTKNGQSLSGDWPGKEGYALDKNIYEFNIMESMKDVNDITLEFNNGKYYKISSDFPGYNKLLNITFDAYGQNGSYEWIDYNPDSIIAGGPVNTGNVKNVIFMIGDGMGVNHIKVAEIYQGYNMIFTDFNNTYVSTNSSSDFITDSAASATALATGKKTINYYVGIDYYGNKIETLAEYAHKKGLKTGLVATQTIKLV